MISIRNIHKSFAAQKVLRGVSLEIEKGGITAIATETPTPTKKGVCPRTCKEGSITATPTPTPTPTEKSIIRF